MSDLIDRDEVIEIIEYVCSADDTYWKPGTLEKIRNLPTHPTPSNTLGALDCVSRQDAIDAMKQYSHFDDFDTSVIDEEIAIIAIKDLPSVQPDKDLIHLQKEQAYMQGYEDGQKPRKGKWIYGEHEFTLCDGYRCDKCGFFVPWDYRHKSIDFINEYNFCPNCGCRMEEGDSE